MNKTIKIDGLFFPIVESREYKAIANQYDNVIDPQKIILKNVVIPKVTKILNDLISNNSNYYYIKVNKITNKYTKNDKHIKIELSYNKDENINKMDFIYQNLMNEYWIALVNYNLYPFYTLTAC